MAEPTHPPARDLHADPEGAPARDTDPAGSPAGRPPAPGRDRARWLPALRSWDSAIIGALLLTVVVASVLVEGFATSRNWGFLLLDVIPIALIALPMTLIIVTGEIDLSVASILGLSSAVVGWLWLAGLTLELALLLAIVLGAVLGLVNGVLTTTFALPSLAVTIGSMALYRGLAFVVLGDQAVADFPLDWTAAAVARIGGIPWFVGVVAVLALLFGAVLHLTPVGRALYAIGNNSEASTFAGISVRRTKLWLYVASGAVSALAGIFWTFRYASARADNGTGLELSVVAAVLLGGISIFGGRGRIVGALTGVLLLGAIRNALQLADVPADALTIVTGGLLIVSVVGPNVVTLTRARLRRRRATPRTASP